MYKLYGVCLDLNEWYCSFFFLTNKVSWGESCNEFFTRDCNIFWSPLFRRIRPVWVIYVKSYLHCEILNVMRVFGFIQLFIMNYDCRNHGSIHLLEHRPEYLGCNARCCFVCLVLSSCCLRGSRITQENCPAQGYRVSHVNPLAMKKMAAYFKSSRKIVFMRLDWATSFKEHSRKIMFHLFCEFLLLRYLSAFPVSFNFYHSFPL